MLCKTKFFLTCIFLCAIFSNSRASVQAADSLFEAGKYFQAAIEYEYLIFTSNDAMLSNSYRLKKALCYKQSGNYKQAVNQLQTIYIPDKSLVLFAEVSYQHALCLYLINDYQNALWKIDDYSMWVSDSTLLARFMPLKALLYNEIHQWDKAQAELINYAGFLPDTEKNDFVETVEQLYSKKNLPKIKKITTAEHLSRYIPGAGQAYAGKPGEGALNFLIQLSCLAFGAHQLSNGFTTFQFWNAFPFTGYLGGIGMLSKVYVGGIKRAGILAAQANNEQMAAFNHQINHLVTETLDE